MKNVVIKLVCITVFSVSIHARKTIQQKLENAVYAGDTLALKRLFRKLDRQDILTAEKKRIVREVLVACGEITKLDPDSFTLIDSRRDLICFIGGSLICVYALSRLAHNIHKYRTDECDKCGAIGCKESCICSSCGRESRGCHGPCSGATYTKSKKFYTRRMYQLFCMLPYQFTALFGYGCAGYGVYCRSQHNNYSAAKEMERFLNNNV